MTAKIMKEGSDVLAATKREASELSALLCGCSYERATSASDHEKRLIYLIKKGIYRAVRNTKRKRKLQKRGEFIWWCPEMACWLWQPSAYGDYDLAA